MLSRGGREGGGVITLSQRYYFWLWIDVILIKDPIYIVNNTSFYHDC